MTPRPRAGLVVFAKAPRPGAVKTRMTPPLDPEQAAGLYACLLEDVLAETARAARELDLEAILAVHPAGACRELSRTVPVEFCVIAQRGRDLAGRMEWAAAEAAAAGLAPVLLRGSDSPSLETGVLRTALAALEAVDLVLCPDRDGGYNLVGLARPVPGLFDHPMSTPSVLEDTLAGARRRGLRVELLEPGFDLDTVQDLRWLAEARERHPGLPCPRTLAYLDAHGLWKHL